jgi:hypothetical protein
MAIYADEVVNAASVVVVVGVGIGKGGSAERGGSGWLMRKRILRLDLARICVGSAAAVGVVVVVDGEADDGATVIVGIVDAEFAGAVVYAPAAAVVAVAVVIVAAAGINAFRVGVITTLDPTWIYVVSPWQQKRLRCRLLRKRLRGIDGIL